MLQPQSGMPRKRPQKKRSRAGSSARKRRRKRSPRLRLKRNLAIALALAAALGAAWLAWPFWQVSEQFGERALRQPSRLYARPTLLVGGGLVRPEAIVEELRGLGYREVSGSPAGTGEYSYSGGRLAVRLRPAPTPAGRRGAGLLEARFHRGRLLSLAWEGRAVGEAGLEPRVLATFYGPDLRERRPVPLAEIPEHLVNAVLAAEDAGFFRHAGLSLSGILRAAWVNLRGGEVRQGGSTLTQQLVKNLFLTHERTFARKLREAALALLIDLRYDKRSILHAYLNEIYWGSSGGASLMGVGAAAWAYFGKRPAELDVAESALLAGIIRSPGGYSPLKQPERARERRDWVLERMGELGWLGREEIDAATARPLGYAPRPVTARSAPYFVDFAVAEARRRFGVGALEDAGLSLLSTLEAEGQGRAEEAVGWGLGALEAGWEKGRRQPGELQGALVSLDPRTGAVLAWVGGRDYGASQFDRASQARRQAGSAFKPVVYATAFERRTAAPSELVEDAPLTVVLAGNDWTPRNDDGEFLGWVTVRTAVEESLNVPTVRVALDADLERVVELARRLGITTDLEPYPALALGAFEVTPVELATAYATVAAGGLRPEVHGLAAVLDRAGKPLAGAPVAEPERVMSPEAAYLLTSVLQGVLDRGTGASARRQGIGDPLAGKTGTTNERRDSWFAGYSPDRVTLIWVGYDDNSTTRLSGARAALPIWARFTLAVRPAGGYPVFDQPPGIVTAVIDPESGDLATDRCPRYLTEVFREGGVPAYPCRLHAEWRDWRREPQDRVEVRSRRGRWRWLLKLFKRDKPRRSRP